MKKQFTVHVDKDIIKKYKHHCIDREVRMSESMQVLMENQIKKWDEEKEKKEHER